MADYTKYKRLELPKSNEKYDVGVANKNNQVIDSELNKLDLKNQSQENSITELFTHKNETSNPHCVTKEQVGLSNVDNTSDTKKPVSDLQQEFINHSLSIHNVSDSSHNDIRQLLADLSTRLNALADSDDETLDQLSEIVAYIKNNKSLIDGITTSKVSVSDIINNLDILLANTVSGKVVDALLVKQVFQSVSDGKTKIASAITDKGIETDATDSFMQMANNITNLKIENDGCYLSSIKMCQPAILEYTVGDALDLSDIDVVAKYEKEKTITSNVHFTPENGTVLTQKGVITVTASYTDNNVTKTDQVNITVRSKYASWQDGSWGEIATILEAHYAGEIDISNYWNIGDTRTVHLSEFYYSDPQDIELTIIDFNHDSLSTNINDIERAAITIQMKNCLMERYPIHGAADNSVGWDGCFLRAKLNNDFKNALPTELQNLIKPVRKVTGKGQKYSTYVSVDHCFLISETEATSYNEYSAVEGYQYEYYKDETNLFKDCDSYKSYKWWWRSPRTSATDTFACFNVAAEGYRSGDKASVSLGIPVAMCL